MKTNSIKTNYIFCQFDTRFLYRDYKETLADQFYNKQWETKAKDGYYKPEEFWEVPTWITEIDGILEKSGHTSKLKILDSIDGKRFKVSQTTDHENIHLFSALDINKQYIREIALQNPDSLFIVGGYIDGVNYFGDIMNIEYVDSIPEFCKLESLPYTYEVSYRLFAGTACIPRLTMSTGCKHNCKFCCVEKDLKEYSRPDVYKQIKAFKALDFKLVYVNDKTFGQADNYKMLWECFRLIRRYNPAFEGFIIQTTAAKCKNAAFCKDLKSMGVKVVELGVETYNGNLLSAYRKPHNCDMISDSMLNLYGAGLRIVPNILIGLIGETLETYKETLWFLNYWSQGSTNFIYSMNAYNLAVYADTDLAKEINADTADSNEMKTQKSYHTKTDKANIDYFYNALFTLGMEILGK